MIDYGGGRVYDLSLSASWRTPEERDLRMEFEGLLVGK